MSIFLSHHSLFHDVSLVVYTRIFDSCEYLPVALLSVWWGILVFQTQIVWENGVVHPFSDVLQYFWEIVVPDDAAHSEIFMIKRLLSVILNDVVHSPLFRRDGAL